MSQIVLSLLGMQDVVDFALATLRDKSPVGSVGDKHPDLYRDSHMVFLNGHNVTDVSAFRLGDQINISNPEPYSRKIENIYLPGHVYEDSVQIVSSRYGNSVSVKFTFMPVTFGTVKAYADFSLRQRAARKLNRKDRADWLVRQPAMKITAR